MKRSEYSAVKTKVNDEEMEAVIETKQPSLPRADTVENTHNDDKKAKCWKYIQHGLVYCICALYFSYQIREFLNVDTNQQISASIDPIQEVELPFFYVAAGRNLNNLTIGPFGGVCNILISDTNASNFTAEPCELRELSYVYNEDTTQWIIIHNDTEDAILLYPPYKKTMKVTQNLLLQFSTEDPYTKHISDPDEYLEFTDNDYDAYRLHWFADNTHFLRNTHILEVIDSKEGIVNNWLRKAYQTIIASFQRLEIDVLNIVKFGNETTKYNLNSIFQGPTQSTLLLGRNLNGTWYHNTLLMVMANALETETTITISQKITIWDCFSKTGGIFALLNPLSALVLVYWLSGFPCKCCKCCKGIAPNTGLSDEEKRKVLTYLKEIKLV